ncbi:Thiol-disulfide isomerase or thioredoxin [Haloechinothrix alba]|uniref:Thiol-disulfide isomerase or thioredoxin n=1 Tax=Haloechinothrix alba TaxID=664784 RepID=A0A238ZLI5_9PSEU|nr:redoxin domain-containing protein [Haloechinothrix alba]SNR84316.1 Thiol-disulfide isomerase or thioredoxin [Haloechinothrix alba]
MTVRIRLLGLALSVLLVLAACGGDGSGARSAEVLEELDFTAETLDGESYSGTELAGEPAVLFFWAPWCSICRHEAPFIAELAAEHGDEVTFLGIASRDDVDAMREFTTRFGTDGFTNLNDEDGEVWTRFGVTAQPAFAFISAGGDIERVDGTFTRQEFDRWLESRATA